MNWALLILYIMFFFDIVIAAYYHGEERPDYNLGATIFAVGLHLALLWWATGWVFI